MQIYVTIINLIFKLNKMVATFLPTSEAYGGIAMTPNLLEGNTMGRDSYYSKRIHGIPENNNKRTFLLKL